MMRAVNLAITVSLISVIGFSTGASAQLNWGGISSLTDVSVRQQQMDQNLTQAVAQGRLTTQEAATFKSELNRIQQMETQYRADGKLNLFERGRLVLELDNLQKRIDAGMHERTAPIVDIPKKQSEIAAELSDALFTGRLTRQEADAFAADLQRIKAKESTFNLDGSLNATETLTLSTELDQLQQNIHTRLRPIAVGNTQIDNKKAEISRRILELKASGTITAAEANSFTQELSRIEAKQRSFEANDGKLGNNESFTLAMDLEQLSTSLDRYRPSGSPMISIDAKQQKIETMISDALRTGQLNSQQVYELKSEFDRIANLEGSFKYDGSISASEAAALNRDLDNLQTRVQTITSSIGGGTIGGGPGGGPRGPQSLDMRISRMKNRLNEADANGRLSPQVSQDLRTQMSRIESRKQYFEQDGVLNENETAMLVTDLDQIRNTLERSMSTAQGPGVGTMRAEIEQKVQDAISGGTLSAQDADVVKEELSRIQQLEDTMRSSGNTLSEQEIAALQREYGTLSARIDRSLPALPDVTAKHNSVAQKIQDAIRSAKLPSTTTSGWQQEFDRIVDAENNYRKSDNKLTAWETNTLAKDFDKLETTITNAMQAPVTPPPVAVDPSSVAPDTRGHWAEQYVALLSKRGTIGGFPDGSFKPNDFITRAQFAAIAVKALGLPEAGRAADFKDVPAKYWANKVISQVSEAGLVTGFPDGTFRPEDRITRAQALVILAKAMQSGSSDPGGLNKYTDGSAVPAWARPSVAKAANANIIVSYPDPKAIRPNDLATRADIAALTYQTMTKLGESLPKITVGLEASE